MLIYVAILIAAVAGVLIGAALVYTLRDDEFPAQALISSLPEDVIEADLSEFSPAEALDENTKRPHSYFRVQSIHDVSRLESDFDQRLALYRLMRQADQDDLERYISESIEISSSNQRMVALLVIFARYAVLDPHKALERVLEHDKFTAQEQRNLVWWIFNEWTVADLDEAIVAIQHLPQEFKQSAASAIMWRSDGLPVNEREELAQRVGPTDSRIESTVDSIRRKTYEDDPRKAYYDRILDSSRSRGRIGEISEIAKFWFESEGALVMSEIYDSLTSVDDQRSVFNRLIWNIDDFKDETAISVLQVVSHFPNERIARDATNDVFQHWANSDPEAAFKASLEIDDQLVSDHLRSSLLSRWASSDAEGLYEEVSTFPQRFQGTAISKSLRHISVDSPQVAIELAQHLDTRALRTSARNAIVDGWLVYDPKSAFEWLVDSNLDVNEQSDEYVWRSTFSEYLTQDYEAARTYVDQHEGKFKAQLVEVTAKHLFANDLERALAYMTSEKPDISESLLHTIAHSLAQSDPMQAFDYGETLEQHLQEEYYESVIYSSSYLNFNSLHDSILRLPQKYRSFAASRLLHQNEEMHYLSDLEIKQLETMVEEERTFARLNR